MMGTQTHFSDSCQHQSTEAVHRRAVERVIREMHRGVGQTLSLQDMADVAYMSVYHFNRVFRKITGIPPCKFLSALRLAAAKKLLVTTDLSVTDVCFEVGYNSLGTFSSRFTNLVGLSPTQFARARARFSPNVSALENGTADRSSSPAAGGFRGQITAEDEFSGIVLAGLFPDPIPQGQPSACTYCLRPGTYRMNTVPDGSYYLLAVGYAQADNLCDVLPSDESGVRVGITSKPLRFHRGRTDATAKVTLRRTCLTDPPILTAIPLLLRSRVQVNGPRY